MDSGTPLRRRLFVLGAAGIVPLAIMAGISLRALQGPEPIRSVLVRQRRARSRGNAGGHATAIYRRNV